MRTHLEEAITNQFPNKMEFRIGYINNASRVRLTEIIRLGDVNDKLAGRQTEVIYDVTKGAAKMVSMKGGGYGLLRLNPESKLLFFPMRMYHEGSSLLSFRYGKKSDFGHAYEWLLRRLTEFVYPSEPQPAYTNTDEKVLNALLTMDDKDIIPNILQWIELEISIYGRKGIGQDISDEVTVKLPTKDALENGLQLKAKSKLNVEFEITGGIGEGRSLNIKAITKKGFTAEIKAKTEVKDVARNSLGYVALLHPVKIERGQVSIEGKNVGGQRKFTKIDIYVNGPLMAHPLTEIKEFPLAARQTVTLLDRGRGRAYVQSQIYDICADLFE